MHRFIMICLLLLVGSLASYANYRITGKVSDTATQPLPGASVSLLNPQDSTMVAFAISNREGRFLISEVKSGNYLLQVAVMGYYTEYRSLSVPLEGEDLGTVALKVNDGAHTLGEVVISGEKVPVRIKGDTLEYNAGSYKVKPNAVVEDLLRKLPGVQVDKEGNIKSMGKDVKKVLVDGKEFFGDDPKMATRNLPADAVDKVQSFEKKSDASLFSGVDDGQRDQTLNLTLKEGKKTGYFGEAKGGLGTPEKYDAALKAFKFRPKSQVAAMGMLNNINKFGFTFQDYLDFNGGLGSLLQGGGNINLNSNEAPVDFGQPVPGKMKSGAAGLNYTLEPWTNSRLNFNYMGNGVDKFLDQYVYRRNFAPGENFEQNNSNTANEQNLTHRLNASWRTEIDSIHQLRVTAYGKLETNNGDGKSLSETYQAALLQNSLDSRSDRTGNGGEVGGTLELTTKLKGKWPVLKTNLNAGYSGSHDRNSWTNTTYLDGQQLNSSQYRDNHGKKWNGAFSFAPTRSLGKSYYLEPSAEVSFQKESLKREQGTPGSNEGFIDSLSPWFYRNVWQLTPGLTLKKTTKKIRWSAELQWQALGLSPYMNGQQLSQSHYAYWLPSAWWQRDFSMGQRLSLQYNTSVTAPAVLQLMPVTDYSNPLLRVRGSAGLAPEYEHHVSINYNHFDQFNMTNFFAVLDGRYTRNKIGWSRLVQPDLSQDITAINTSYAIQAALRTQYGRPVKKIGLNITAGLEETWNRTLGPVNGIENINNTLTHKLKLGFNNLKSDVWDVSWGGSIALNQSFFSLNTELNNIYYNFNGYAEISYRPTVNWSFTLSGDIDHYAAQSFDKPVTIPLIKAEISRYVFKSQRGTISLTGFDLLDRNKSVLRTSQLNYLLEQRSNTIGRYGMLSFTYKLNKAGSGGPSINIKQR
ncbi:TonB-dependent receptor [Taibaiella koreensis]|uniref:TonB-dependent receptor n=1 Tax=Taibaiella koreensis TaxID=1268548 RepID=UPI000E59F0A4|nr:TonB-dependent receptor [Taibaiella koreensis]